MPVVLASNKNIRHEVRSYIRERKRHGRCRVLDVGGAGNPWCDDLVDGYIDILDPKTSKAFFKGNINHDDVWEQAAACGPWDFTICTHVLEDIANPGFVLERLQRISRAGFIAVPNKHTEFVNVESGNWVGYCHHRWIFTLVNGAELRFIAKFPIANAFSRQHWIQRLFSVWDSHWVDRIQSRMRWAPGRAVLPWLNVELAATRGDPTSRELGFIWETEFRWDVINGDFAGMHMGELRDLYRFGLREGL